MGLLPEVVNGKIVEERRDDKKQSPAYKRWLLYKKREQEIKENAGTLEWARLLDNECPMCGGRVEEWHDKYHCVADNDCIFEIKSFKFVKITKSIREEREQGYGFIRYLQ